LAREYHQKIIDILEADAAAAADARNKGYLMSAYNYIGFAEAGATNYDLALTWFNKTLAIDPNNASALEAIANVAAVRGGK
jgi:tetratricopeptide (TPR) repeat protein